LGGNSSQGVKAPDGAPKTAPRFRHARSDDNGPIPFPHIRETSIQDRRADWPRAEVTEMMVPLGMRGQHDSLHFIAVVAVKGVAFDIGDLNALATKNLFERLLYRTRARSGGACDRDDWVLG